MKSFLLAFQFLTIIPLWNQGKTTEQDMGRAVAFFPLIGIFQGAILYTLAWCCEKIFPYELTACLVVFLLYLINGGLHIDGLADTFDGLAATHHNREKRLAIMKDSASGPIGVLAIVMIVLLKWIALKTLLAVGSIEAVVIMPVLGKWAMVPMIFSGKPARQDSIGRVFMDNVGYIELLAASGIAGVICATLGGLIAGLGVMFLVYCISLGLRVFFTGRFGGLTGDSLGAVCEIAEAGSLVLYIAILSVIS